MDERGRLQALIDSVGGNALYGAVTLIGVTLYSRFGTVWTKPIINGLLAGLLVFCILLARRATTLLPIPRETATLSNIEKLVLKWTHRFHLSVKNDPVEGFHFNYVLTTDGMRQIAVGRSSKEWTEYLNFASKLTTNDSDRKMLAALSSKERAAISVAMKLELARAQMGYSNFSLEGFVISRRIPISTGLDEASFIEAVWKMEAVINSLFMVATSFIVQNDEVSGPVLELAHENIRAEA